MNDSLLSQAAASATSWLVGLPRGIKRGITMVADATLISTCLALALFIRIPERAAVWVSTENLTLMVVFVVSTIGVWSQLGLYKAILRYLDIRALSTIFAGAMISTVLLAMFSFLSQAGLPRSIPIIYLGLVLITVAGSRLVVRGLLESTSRFDSQKVIIYGAGAAGRQLCVALQNGSEFEPVVFVDDDVKLHSARVLGISVVSPSSIPALVESKQVCKILFAIPSASNSRKSSIFNAVENLGIEMLTIPSSVDLVNGTVTINSLRSLDIDDLLGREPVNPDVSLLRKCIEHKVVLVTGAGGSIGSELCRQILVHNPARLILLDHSELNLYSIEREIKNRSGVDISAILGSVTDSELMQNIFKRWTVDTVYHAAAYKHVPLVELNVANGLANNVLGTQCVTETALMYDVKHFILVSTDKAVRPANVMGASKRLAELVVQEAAIRSENTVFAMVRFGNVLGSSGSVVPLFTEQINAGGPLTVTHPSVTRYFMTVPEAASLVIQAGAMATGGEVFVLDMGEPVKVLDLAHKMIRLMGYSVKDEQNLFGDIEVKFTGLRPGEKLYEELLVGENAQGTKHPRIMCAQEESLTSLELQALLSQLYVAIEASDFEAIREVLITAPLGYKPSGPISDNLFSSGPTSQKVVEQGNVTFLEGPRD